MCPFALLCFNIKNIFFPFRSNRTKCARFAGECLLWKILSWCGPLKWLNTYCLGLTIFHLILPFFLMKIEHIQQTPARIHSIWIWPSLMKTKTPFWWEWNGKKVHSQEYPELVCVFGNKHSTHSLCRTRFFKDVKTLLEFTVLSIHSFDVRFFSLSAHFKHALIFSNCGVVEPNTFPICTFRMLNLFSTLMTCIRYALISAPIHQEASTYEEMNGKNVLKVLFPF